MISATFFFLFSQLAAGMLLTLLFISPRVVGGSFFQFSSQTAAILMGVALGFELMFPSPVRNGTLPSVLLLVSAVLTGVYNRTVHIERYGLALYLLIAATAVGLAAIGLDAFAFSRLMDLGGWEHWLLIGNHLTATALLGSGMLTMIFGHWYLVVPNLSIDPLRWLAKVYLATIGLRMVAILGSLAVLEIERHPGWLNVVSEILIRRALFSWPRFGFGILVPLILGGMIRSTLRLGHTQAATGLLYLVVVALLFGEFFSKFLLFELELPL